MPALKSDHLKAKTETERDDNLPSPVLLRTFTPLKPKTPGGFSSFNQNDDGEERVRIRAMKAAAKRKSILPDTFPDLTGNNSQASQEDNGLSETRISELLQNCIKLSSENKINQRNSWDLQLIDHISEIIKSDDKRDSQTNFQKASCTLEASVKIYGFRVDSVHTDTFKVLGGLSRTAEGEDNNDEANGEGGADEANGDSDEQQGKSKHPKKSNASSAVLENSLEALNFKKFDAAFAVDPLFHQTSAQFDEGGAKGLLLNNLSVYGGWIVFDSDEKPDKVVTVQGQTETSMELLDLSFMEDTIESMLAIIDQDCEITPSLKNILSHVDDPRRRVAEEEIKREREALKASAQSQREGPNDTNNGVDFNGPDDDGDVSNDGGDFDDIRGPDDDIRGSDGCDAPVFNDPVSEVPEAAADFDNNGFGEPENFENTVSDGEVEDPESNGNFGFGATQWLAARMGMDLNEKSDIGSRHWKYCRPKENAEGTSEANPPKPKKSKSRGEPVYIDFFNLPNIDVTRPPNDMRQITLPKASRSTVANTLRPKYRRYDASELTQLFLRPSWNLWGKNQKRTKTSVRGTGESGQSFYNTDGGDGFGGGWEGGDDNVDFGGEDFGDEVDFDSSEIINDDGLVAAPRKVEKISVDYAKQSKQVDVRILKETIWERLDDPLLTTSEHEDNEDEMENSQGASFKKLLQTFPKDCQAANPEDISVHLCFICLLHLANEHNLVIKGSSHMDELKVSNLPVRSNQQNRETPVHGNGVSTTAGSDCDSV